MNTNFNKIMDIVSIFNSISTLRETPKSYTEIPFDELRLNHILILEEATEYFEACVEKDPVKIADAIGDMMFLVMRIACQHGLKETFLKNVLIPIMESNATKPCNTLKEAKQSIRNYEEKGAYACYVEYGGQYIIFRRSDMKILKGVNYVEPKIVI
jgi:phosphoribosyl-ATP pyrophosphohydrolase